MDKRQRLISMINASDESNDNWYQSTHFIFGGEHDPTYCEYMNLRHRLGLEPDIDRQTAKQSLLDGGVHFHFEKDGTWKGDEGELADQNRAMWRKWIDEHKDDDIDLI